jgi:S-DNA-T family DNA segregation ATPase FtsK/SpoIIIE
MEAHMATRMKVPSRTPILPSGVSIFFRRRLIELWGLALTIAGFAVLLTLFSYNPADPSLNAAAAGPIQNWLGTSGAWAADVMMQTMGLAAFIVPPVLIVWGLRTGTHRGIGYLWLRITILPIAVLLGAVALAGFDTAPAWPLKAGYGGLGGDTLLAATAAWSAQLTSMGTDLVALIAGILAISATVGALGLTENEWRRLARGMVWLGRRSIITGQACRRGAIQTSEWIAGCVKRGHAAAKERLEPRLGPASEDDETPSGRKVPARRQQKSERAASNRATKSGIVVPRSDDAKPGKRAEAARQTAMDLGPADEYVMPGLDLLQTIITDGTQRHLEEGALAENARLLESVLDDFGVDGEVVKVRPGPVVTLYEFEPAPGIKSSRIIGLANDIARSMSAVSARVAVIPGRSVMGIELPNVDRETVSLHELLASESLEKTQSTLSLALGKDIGGSPVIADLVRMPHLLIAGTTGSGKSVAINTMILSLLYRLSPEQCRLIMIDPKMLELSVYEGIPHLLCPVVTDSKKAVVALRWTVREMEQRYRLMSTLGVRNIAGYNDRLKDALRNGEALTRTVQTGFDKETREPVYEEHPLDMTPLPYIVVIVDEMADLMLVAGKEVEASVQRIAQMARAAGIHLIMATQRPSVDVITGTIKANFPTRISFQVTSKIDSRTILGEAGAEQLLGQGDMLYMAGGGRLTRVHGPLVTDSEVERVVTFLKKQATPDYVEGVTREEAGDAPSLAGTGDSEADALYDQAVALVCRERKASTSFIQRHLQIGYNRAARIVDQMEAEGVITAADHVGRRKVLARNIDVDE